MHRFSVSSLLGAPPDVVWRHITTMDGVNDEMKPLLRMTVPPALRDARIDDLPAGAPAGRSWLLLLGALPVDYDDLTIAAHGPGYRFREESTMLTQARWEHERVLQAVDGGCRIEDTLAWVGRSALLGVLYRFAVPMLFRHRHRRLRKRFGVPPR